MRTADGSSELQQLLDEQITYYRALAPEYAHEMLAIASARHNSERVRFIQADIFNWEPVRRYDVVFFGFGSPMCRSTCLNRSGRK